MEKELDTLLDEEQYMVRVQGLVLGLELELDMGREQVLSMVLDTILEQEQGIVLEL